MHCFDPLSKKAVNYDMGPLILDLIGKGHDLEGKLLASMGGAELSESGCERVGSAANKIMTADRTLLNSEMLEKLCILQMNKS